MEKVELRPMKPRLTEREIIERYPWATTGKTSARKQNVLTSLALDAAVHERLNQTLQNKYKLMEENEVRYETLMCDDADYVIVAYGCMSRICESTVEHARKEGIKLGLLRPVTLYPFPTKYIQELTLHAKFMMSVELSAGQMVEDIRLAVNGKIPVGFYGRLGGIVPSPEEVLEAFKEQIKKLN